MVAILDKFFKNSSNQFLDFEAKLDNTLRELMKYLENFLLKFQENCEETICVVANFT